LITYLDSVNEYTERDRMYDAQIVLAVVESLGRIGSPRAFDSLLQAAVLDYPDNVKRATRAALEAVEQ
jgi:HEAT repeat protein